MRHRAPQELDGERRARSLLDEAVPANRLARRVEPLTQQSARLGAIDDAVELGFERRDELERDDRAVEIRVVATSPVASAVWLAVTSPTSLALAFIFKSSSLRAGRSASVRSAVFLPMASAAMPMTGR